MPYKVENKPVIVVVGLGYVGLPLANAFAKTGKYHVHGYDANEQRLRSLQDGVDLTNNEAPHPDLHLDQGLVSGADYYIVTVPTPIKSDNSPDLSPLVKASTDIGKALANSPRVGLIPMVIYESTVHPSCTETTCTPLLAEHSSLVPGGDFYVGYSPERVSPGENHVTGIKKLVSTNDGLDAQTRIFELYSSILDTPPVLVSSMAVAEASKIFENTQRDVLIALVNEFSTLCHELRIDTNEVIDAASTKWNFAPLRPGLVGGHCIGVDPYYLIDLANTRRVDLPVVKTARRQNQTEHPYQYGAWVKACLKDRNIDSALILGYTFKPNVTDTRNTGVKTLAEAIIDSRGLPSGAKAISALSVYESQIPIYEERRISLELGQLAPTPVYFTSSYGTVGEVGALILAVRHDSYTEEFFRRVFAATRATVILDLFGKLKDHEVPKGIEVLRY